MSEFANTQTGERNEKAFFSKLKEIADEVKKRDDFVVVYHYDADGCSAGAIAVKALEREGKKVCALPLKQLYKENISEIKEMGKNFLFVDFGAGQLEHLIEGFGKDFFVLDHHQPAYQGGKIIEHEWHANPLLFGINGGSEISGAGVSFFFAKELNKKNSDLAYLAIVGALGDMQDSRGALDGMNREILKIAEQGKQVSAKIDLRLYGRISRPLISYLMFSSNPIIPQLTAEQENTIAFLKENKIPLKRGEGEKWLSYEDLTPEEKKRLSSALILHMHRANVPEWKIQELVGEVYTLLNEDGKGPLRDGKEFATLLNSCGRHAKADVALAVCMGDRDEKYEEALILLKEHSTALRKGIEFIHAHGVEERKSFYFFDAGSEIQDSLVGIIAGMLYGSIIQENKPIIALARNEDGTVKVSGRGTSYLVRRGLNIGQALKELEKEVEGMEGGGHKVAAGAKVPEKKLELFLQKLEEKFEVQLTGGY
ncbi:MAG: DHH family phosphoesterase [archaeon]